MGLLKVDIIKKVNGIKAKFEKKEDELIAKRKRLLQEQDMLRSAIEDDFQRQIMEESTPDKKLKNDYDKVNSELGHVKIQLESLNGLLSKELAKYKEEVSTQAIKFKDNYREEEQQLLFELKKAKLAYIEKLIEYDMANRQANQGYVPYRELMNSLGVKGTAFFSKNLTFDFYQTFHTPEFHGIISNEEQREAYEGKMPSLAKRFKQQNNL